MSAVFKDDIRIEEVAHAKVETRPGVSATEYRITGTLTHVLEAVAAVFGSWPAMGYGTMVHAMTAEGVDAYICRMSRSNSCD